MLEKKKAELQGRMKARTAAVEVRKHIPQQFAFWPENHRAMANELARSALFNCKSNRKARSYIDNAPLFVLGEGSLTYKGEELRSNDEDILITLAHYAREMSSDTMRVAISSSEICKANGWRQSQQYFTEIFRSVQRMKGGVITVYSKRLAKALKCYRALEAGASDGELARLYDELGEPESMDSNDGEIAGMMLSLVSGSTVFTGATSLKDGIPQGNLKWEIALDKKLVSLFAKPYLTFVDRQVRQALSPSGKRLQAYFLSHKTPYPVLLRSLEKLLGQSYNDLKTLKFDISRDLDELKLNQVIADYSFTRSSDGADWLVSVSR